MPLLNDTHKHYQFKIDMGKKYATLSTCSKQHIWIPKNETITFEACWPYKANSNTHLFGSKRTNKKLLYKTTTMENGKIHTALQVVKVDPGVLFGIIHNSESEHIVLDPGEVLGHVFCFEKDVFYLCVFLFDDAEK